jgi:NodT family efflux transporter outer membrane factor (OMF) lipoprotein
MKARRRRVLITIAMALGVWVAGCEVGPNYHPPRTDVPAVFGATAAPSSRPASNKDSTIVADHAVWADWWTKFGDEELDSLIARAVVANHELKIAAARVQEARAVERVAASELYPTIDLSAAFLKTRGSAAGFGFPYGAPGMDRSLYQIGFDATYEVDLFGGIRRSVEAAGASAEATEDQRRGVQVSLLGEVAREYIGLRALQRRLAIARQNLEDQQRTLGIVQKRVKNGLAPTFDLVRARAQVDSTSSGIPPIEAGIEQTIYVLSVLLGQEPLALSSELTAAAPIPPVPPEVPIGLPSELLRRRPDVMGAERELAAATAVQGVAVSDLFPHLILGGTAGVQSLKADKLFSQHDPSSGFYLAGPVAQWTFFDGGRRGANVDRAKAQVRAALSAYEDTVLRALQEVDGDLVAYSHDQAQRDELVTLVADSQEAVRIAKGEYANGLIDLLDVLDVQRNLYAAQDALAQAQQTVSSDLVALYKALGGGWETGQSTAGKS